MLFQLSSIVFEIVGNFSTTLVWLIDSPCNWVDLLLLSLVHLDNKFLSGQTISKLLVACVVFSVIIDPVSKSADNQNGMKSQIRWCCISRSRDSHTMCLCQTSASINVAGRLKVHNSKLLDMHEQENTSQGPQPTCFWKWVDFQVRRGPCLENR